MPESARPRVCLLTETFHPATGGGETQVLALATGLARRGHAVCVMTRRHVHALPRVQVMRGIPVYRLALSGRGRVRKWSLLFSAGMALFRRRRRYDVIVVSGFRILGIPALLAGRLLGKPVILKADNNGEMNGAYFRDGLAALGLRPDSWPVRGFLRWRNALLQRCARFVAISTPLRRELEECGVPAGRIVEIPNSVDCARFVPVSPEQREALRTARGIDRAAFVVIYTGRLVDYKGLPLLLDTWRDACNRYGNCLLLLVGSGGQDMHNCEAGLHDYVDRHGLADRVRFTGSTDAVAGWLQLSDVFVLPTEREAFGIALVEAMACGLPVIATTTGGIPDLVRPDREGLLVPVNDADALRDALDRLYGDRALRARLGQQGRARAERDYAQDAVVERYGRLVGEVQSGS